MSTLGSDTVCNTGSWLLSAPSSASSLPAAGNKEGTEGLSPKMVESGGGGGVGWGGDSRVFLEALGARSWTGTSGKSPVGSQLF